MSLNMTRLLVGINMSLWVTSYTGFRIFINQLHYFSSIL